MNASMARKCRYPHGWYKNRNIVDQSIRQKANQHVFVVILLDFVQNLWSLSQNVNVSKDNMPASKKRENGEAIFYRTLAPVTWSNFIQQDIPKPLSCFFGAIANLSMPGAIFLEDPGFRDLACSHQLSTSWNCSHSESSLALIGNPQRSAVRAGFLVAVSFKRFKLLRFFSFCKVVLSSCLNACRLSGVFWRNLYLNDEKEPSETSPQKSCLPSFRTNIRGGPWHRWRRTNPLKSHLEERGEIPPMFFFDSFNQLDCLLIHKNFNSNLIILTAGPRIHQSSNS